MLGVDAPLIIYRLEVTVYAPALHSSQRQLPGGCSQSPVVRFLADILQRLYQTDFAENAALLSGVNTDVAPGYSAFSMLPSSPDSPISSILG